MSIISGYSVGVKLIAQFRDANYLTDDEAKRLLPLASTSGPMFILGTIVSMTGDRKSGIIILICHILSSLITGLIFRIHDKKLCEKTIWIENSDVKTYGDTEEVTKQYLDYCATLK